VRDVCHGSICYRESPERGVSVGEIARWRAFDDELLAGAVRGAPSICAELLNVAREQRREHELHDLRVSKVYGNAMPRPNRPQLALLRGKRGPQVLDDWTREFGEGSPELAKRYALAVATFLGRDAAVEGDFEAFVGTYSPRTRRAYAFAITEFFEWLASEHARIVPPHSVTTMDAERYVQWLSDRTYSLEAERLRDGDEPERLTLFETVEQLGSADLASIAHAVPASLKSAHPRTRTDTSRIDREWLSAELGRMVLHDLLVRTPTMEELRRENPRLGIDVFTVEVPEGTSVREVPFQDIFQYAVPTPRAVSRSTIALRLTALSSFWDVLAQGENVEGGHAILKYNVFKQIKKRVLRGLAAEKREAAARANQLTPEIIEKLLGAVDGPTLADKRNAALLWFLALPGARVSEAVAIRRGKPPTSDENRWPGWFDHTSEPVGVWLRRKGNKLQWLPFPPYALRALHAFQADLDDRKPKPGAQPFDPDAPGYVQPDSPKWRYQELAEQDDAPLFPPVNFWGANSTLNYQEFKPNLPNTRGGTPYTRPMTRHGVEKLLKRVAKKAGLSTEDQTKVHAHALRHFAATAMIAQGKAIREVQAILGHESITTTERYLAEEKRPVALSGQNEILDYIAGARPPEGVQPPVPRQPRVAIPREVIETYGIAAEEPRERPPERPPRRPKKRPRPKERPSQLTAEEVQELIHEHGPQEAARMMKGVEIAGEAPTVEDIVDAIEEQLPGPEPEDMPPTSPVLAEPAEIVHDTAEGQVVALAGEPVPDAATEIREDDEGALISPGSPFDVYADLEPDVIARLATGSLQFTKLQARETAAKAKGIGKRRAEGLSRLARPDKVQKNKWLLDNDYDPWPPFYGLSAGALLPWFSRLEARNGVLKVDTVHPTTGKRAEVLMPPLPVLSPDQVYPETVQSRQLFDALERLTKEYMRSAPTKLFGLRRWYSTFASITALLEVQTGAKYNWVPFDSKAKVGEDIRAHADEYLIKWFEQNAGRYTLGLKVMKEKVGAPQARVEQEVEIFQREIEAAARQAVTFEDIPEWFVSEDPVREIYERSPEEWERFVEWLGAITGKRMTPKREELREGQKSFAQEEIEHRRAQAEVLLDTYYSYVDMLRPGTPDYESDKSTRDYYKTLMHGGVIEGREVAGLVGELAALGVGDPRSAKGDEGDEGERRQTRIRRLLAKAFPETDVQLANPNVLQSQLFDAEAFRIDDGAKTIKHTDAFRRRFAVQFDNRDSECIMRRAARAMWEYVTGAPGRLEPTTKAKAGSVQSMLYATMLQYISWIFPCPDDIEAALREHEGVAQVGHEMKIEWLVKMNREVRARLKGEETQEDIPEAHKTIGADAAILLQGQNVDAAIPQEQLLQEGLGIAARGGEKRPEEEEARFRIPKGQRKIISDLLAAPDTRDMRDEEIARKALPEDATEKAVERLAAIVAEMREEIGVVRGRPSPVTPVIRRKGKRRRVVANEPSEEARVFFVTIEPTGPMKRNAPPQMLLSPRVMARCLSYMANAERALPSPMQMIAAMTIAY
jgi:site-specific recombinase XerD